MTTQRDLESQALRSMRMEAVELDQANYVVVGSPTRANDNIAAGRPCYCGVVPRCDFCAGLAALCGPRADDFWAWHRDSNTAAE